MQIQDIDPSSRPISFQTDPNESIWSISAAQHGGCVGHTCWFEQENMLWIRHIDADEQQTLHVLDYARHWAKSQARFKGLVELINLPSIAWPHTPMSWAQQVEWGVYTCPALNARITRGARPWQQRGASTLLMREEF